MESTPIPGQKIESKDWQKFIPVSKSWINRMGILDMINGYDDIKKFLDEETDLGDDLLALKRILPLWNTDEPLDVGESGTLYRILQFISWKRGLNKKFIKRGTLADRINTGRMTQDPNIVNLSQRELLELPEKTTQWATAAVLAGDPERLPDPEYHLGMTYEAVDHWRKQRDAGLGWEPRPDETLNRQAEVFLKMTKGEHPNFVPVQGEDYCFARAFGYMNREEGELKWPKLQGNETPRLDEMERVITLAEAGQPIDSPDHRVVQAMAMWGIVNKKELKFTEEARRSVNKSWPLFWEFLKSVS
jgi:hypothetical protein